jgi:hypothetical protein
MVEFALRARAESIQNLGRVFDHLEQFAERFIEPASVEAQTVWIRTIDQKFAEEGPGWPDLAQSTIRERAQLLGPSLGAHPILERFGYLRRSLTDWTFEGPRSVSYDTWSLNEGLGQKSIETGNEIETRRQPGYGLYRWVIYDERFEALMVDRPMVPLGGEAEGMCKEIEDSLVRLAELMGGPSA